MAHCSSQEQKSNMQRKGSGGSSSRHLLTAKIYYPYKRHMQDLRPLHLKHRSRQGRPWLSLNEAPSFFGLGMGSGLSCGESGSGTSKSQCSQGPDFPLYPSINVAVAWVTKCIRLGHLFLGNYLFGGELRLSSQV